MLVRDPYFHRIYGFRLVYATSLSVQVYPHSHFQLMLDLVSNLQYPALMMLEVQE